MKYAKFGIKSHRICSADTHDKTLHLAPLIAKWDNDLK